jgi:hypothetical protein
MNGSKPVRRVARASPTKKLSATGSDVLPQTIQQHQKLIYRRKRIRYPCYRFFRLGSSGGRAANDAPWSARRTQLDQHRGRLGNYTLTNAMFGALKVLAIISSLYMLKKCWFLGTQEQGFGATFPSHLSRPIAVGFRFRTSQRSSQFYMPLPMDAEVEEEAEYVDHGELDLNIFEQDGQQRSINYYLLEEDDSINEGNDEHDYYYAFDDDTKRNPYIGWEDKTLQDEKKCRRVSWHRLLLLNCNSFHELGLATNAIDSFSLKG